MRLPFFRRVIKEINAETVDFPGVFGDSGRTRTCNPLLRRQMLYPVELRSHGLENKRKTQGKARALAKKVCGECSIEKEPQYHRISEVIAHYQNPSRERQRHF